jgi:hypothetical protein
MTAHADSTLDWLLEKNDPGVRYFALRDLVGAPPDDKDLVAARRATVRHTPVREILEPQDRDGFWVKAGAGYSPKYTDRGQVIFLGQFGADGTMTRPACHQLHPRPQPLRAGGFSVNGSPVFMIHCLQGNLGASLPELGCGDDPRLKAALDWLARSITGEGIAPAGSEEARRYYRSGNSAPGFCCAANNHKPCGWGAIPALDALSRVPVADRTPALRRALRHGVDFLLSTDPAGAACPMGAGTKPNGSWFKFGYPMGYVTDVLRNAEDPRGPGQGQRPTHAPVQELIASKRQPDGRWPARVQLRRQDLV